MRAFAISVSISKNAKKLKSNAKTKKKKIYKHFKGLFITNICYKFIIKIYFNTFLHTYVYKYVATNIFKKHTKYS